MIGQAVGDLGDRLAQATEERAALTRRLLEIRNDERRVLARELHDEFGQNLAAILAFASTIEVDQRAAAGPGQERGRAGRADDLAGHPSHHGLPARYLEPPAPSARRGTRAGSLPHQISSIAGGRGNAAQPMIQLDLKGDLADVRGAVAATAYRDGAGMPDQLAASQRGARDSAPDRAAHGSGKRAADPRRGRWRRRCGQGGDSPQASA